MVPYACFPSAVVLLLACGVGRAQESRMTTLPPVAEATDTIFVHWNLAAMMPTIAGELLTYAGLYHASVSFTNARTTQASFVQFVAPSFGAPLMFPNLSTNFSRQCKDPKFWNTSLTWNNPGNVMFVDEAHTGHHWKHRTFVAVINGIIYNSFRTWVHEAMATYTDYYLFHAITDVFKEYKGKNAFKGHGGIPIDDGRSGFTAEMCQASCTNDLRCNCATIDSSGKCFKRAWCNHSSFANDGNFTTYVKNEVETGRKALTCMQFAHLALTQIYSLAGPCVFDPVPQGILTDDPIVHVRDAPTLLDPSDPKSLGGFCRYYSRMDTIGKGITGGIGQKLLGFAVLLEEFALDWAILHHADRYYSFRPVFPFVSYRKRYVSLPGSGECSSLDAFGDKVMLV